MVRRGDMMSLTDVQDILAVNMIGAIPDDETSWSPQTRENL
mgnify:CR=1 FL=1